MFGYLAARVKVCLCQDTIFIEIYDDYFVLFFYETWIYNKLADQSTSLSRGGTKVSTRPFKLAFHLHLLIG